MPKRVKLPSRGPNPVNVSQQVIDEFYDELISDDLPADEGIQADDTFLSESSANFYARKLRDAIAAKDPERYFTTIHKRVKLGTTVQQPEKNGPWTVTIRNWLDRDDVPLPSEMRRQERIARESRQDENDNAENGADANANANA